MTATRERRSPVRRLLLLLVLAALAAALVGVLSSVPLTDYLHRQPVSLTELSFRAPAALPATAVPGQPVQFAWTVLNHSPERRSITVLTSVVDEATSARTPAATVTVVLAPGAAVTRSESVVAPAAAVRVVVSVPDGPYVAFHLRPAGTGP